MNTDKKDLGLSVFIGVYRWLMDCPLVLRQRRIRHFSLNGRGVMEKKSERMYRQYPVGFQKDALERMKHCDDIRALGADLGVIGGHSAHLPGGSHSSGRIPTAASSPTVAMTLSRNAWLKVSNLYSRSTDTIRSSVLSIRAERLASASSGAPACGPSPVMSSLAMQK